jgi:RNA polymerase sigma-70 factor (ECF subfamily)
VAVTEAVERLFAVLPPRERAAVALVDALGLDAAEAAACLGGTPGAVRVALHRGRMQLGRTAAPAPADPPVPDPVVAAFCAAFSRRDIAACAALLLTDARCEVLGCVSEFGRTAIVDGSLAHTLAEEDDPQAAPVAVDGETAIAIRYRSSAGRVLGDLVRVVVEDGAIARLEHGFFCPELLAAAGLLLGEPARSNGWRFGLPG